MPQVRIKGIETEKVIKISEQIIEKISEITKCPREYVDIEVIESKVIKEGQIANPSPFIEIYWFDRGQEATDKVAEALYQIAREIGIESCDIAFIIYQRNYYYEAGKHF